jgi:exodeoxyribonuclease V alpha subunit
MTYDPRIEWLIERWGMPRDAVPAVEALLREEAGGGTACKLDAPVADWGNAASGPEGESPLVLLDGSTHLQSRWLYQTETAIAARLLAMAAAPEGNPPEQPLAKRLFPDADDLQTRAAQVATTRKLAIITGGPGTGKTYTLARILAALVAAGTHNIRLAAPTGKAADRMKAAVTESLASLPAPLRGHAETLARVAESSSTLHKLLGVRPGQTRAPRRAIACGALIVDECSMIDVLLWHAVLASLPDGASLILLGDPNQLESVGRGSVFSEIVKAAADSPSLRNAHVHLTQSRRFNHRPDLLAFVAALEQSDAPAATSLLESKQDPAAPGGLSWLGSPGPQMTCGNFPPSTLAALENVATAPTPQAALEALGKICILSAHREYPTGSRALGNSIDEFFLDRPDAINRPVIINRNDPETGLRNGSVGIIHSPEGTPPSAWFPSGSGSLKEFTVARLPDFSPAWAITIHRSQGSEYDDVLVVLPREESPLATRELLYTAVTRAKNTVHIASDPASIAKAVRTPSARQSLLGYSLKPEQGRTS